MSENFPCDFLENSNARFEIMITIGTALRTKNNKLWLIYSYFLKYSKLGTRKINGGPKFSAFSVYESVKNWISRISS